MNGCVHEMILGRNAIAQTVDMLNHAAMVDEYQIYAGGSIVNDYWVFGYKQKPEKWKIEGRIPVI